MAGFGVPATRPTVLPGLDGVTRCSWATETGLDLTGYHDREWGVPTRDEAVLFEALALTYFENGLSWATVFRKRDAFRRAFHHFEPDAVAALTASDVELLMKDASIVRNRAKIEATIHNARLLTAAVAGRYRVGTSTAATLLAADVERRPHGQPGVPRIWPPI